MAIETAMFRTIPFENDRIERLIDAAGALLSSSLGYKATSIPTEMFVDRWGPKRNVVRCKVDSTCPDAPDTVILRRVRDTDAYDPADTRTSGPTYQMFDYWAGASFLSTLTPEQSPMFYGGHLEGGFILIEDVGARMSVVNALAGGDSEEAEHELLDLATCLGTIHAKSAGSEAQYLELRNALSSNKEQVSYRDANFVRINLAKLMQTLSSLGLGMSADADKDIQTVIASVENPGSFLSFIHRDPIPPNFLRTDRGLVTIDLEFSGYGHALTDAMSFRMGFPTYGLPGRLPAHVMETFELNYRRALAEGCKAAGQDTIYGPAAVEAWAWWLMFELIRNLEKTTDETEISASETPYRRDANGSSHAWPRSLRSRLQTLISPDLGCLA